MDHLQTIIERLLTGKVIEPDKAYRLAHLAARGFANPAQVGAILSLLQRSSSLVRSNMFSGLLRYFNDKSEAHSLQHISLCNFYSLNYLKLAIAAMLKLAGFTVVAHCHMSQDGLPLELKRLNDKERLDSLSANSLCIEKYYVPYILREFASTNLQLALPKTLLDFGQVVLPFKTSLPIIELLPKEALYDQDLYDIMERVMREVYRSFILLQEQRGNLLITLVNESNEEKCLITKEEIEELENSFFKRNIDRMAPKPLKLIAGFIAKFGNLDAQELISKLELAQELDNLRK